MGVSGDADNDWVRFATGYEDASNYYYFSWTRSEAIGAQGPVDGWHLIQVNDGVSTTLASDESDYTKGWEMGVDYNVTISYTSGKMSIYLKGGTLAFEDGVTVATVNGDFPSGKFAFYGSSQPGLNFSALKFEHLYMLEISLVGDATVTVEGATSYSESGAVASDFEDGNLTSSVTTTGTVDLNTLGSYELHYSIIDSSGIEANVNRTVNVVDTTIPVITRTGESTVTLEGATIHG